MCQARQLAVLSLASVTACAAHTQSDRPNATAGKLLDHVDDDTRSFITLARPLRALAQSSQEPWFAYVALRQLLFAFGELAPNVDPLRKKPNPTKVLTTKHLIETWTKQRSLEGGFIWWQDPPKHFDPSSMGNMRLDTAFQAYLSLLVECSEVAGVFDEFDDEPPRLAARTAGAFFEGYGWYAGAFTALIDQYHLVKITREASVTEDASLREMRLLLATAQLALARRGLLRAKADESASGFACGNPAHAVSAAMPPLIAGVLPVPTGKPLSKDLRFAVTWRLVSTLKAHVKARREGAAALSSFMAGSRSLGGYGFDELRADQRRLTHLVLGKGELSFEDWLFTLNRVSSVYRKLAKDVFKSPRPDTDEHEVLEDALREVNFSIREAAVYTTEWLTRQVDPAAAR